MKVVVKFSSACAEKDCFAWVTCHSSGTCLSSIVAVLPGAWVLLRNSGPLGHLEELMSSSADIPRDNSSARFSDEEMCFHWWASVKVWIVVNLLATNTLNLFSVFRIIDRTIKLSVQKYELLIGSCNSFRSNMSDRTAITAVFLFFLILQF